VGFDMPSGDVSFGDDLFSYQHSPEIQPNGNILLFDNGNRRGHSFCEPDAPYSAGVELAVDPDAPEPVTVVWRYEQDAYSSAFGDADRMPNGNTVLTAGLIGLIQEVSPEGELVWELQADPPMRMYRSERILSLYPLPGDTDGDDDVDLIDYGGLDACLRGPEDLAIHRSCLVYDLDFDEDVDLRDAALFTARFTGSD
jgi:hypothetical protein